MIASAKVQGGSERPRPRGRVVEFSAAQAGVAPSVIMKMTGHKTAAMFNRYNTVDMQDAQEAYRKLKEHLDQEHQLEIPDKKRAGAKKCSHSAPGQKMG